MKVVAFTKVSLPYGWLGNMAPYPITYKQKVFKTSEHLFQCMKLENWPEAFEEVRTQKSPMSAKMVSKKYKHLVVHDPVQIFDNMMVCLQLKLEQHPELKQELIKTGDAEIVEDCTKRPRGGALYWGAALQADGTWKGNNILGNAWMIIREELIEKEK